MSGRDPHFNHYDPEVSGYLVKSFGYGEIVIETCKERGIPVVLIRPDLNADHVTLRVMAEEMAFKCARAVWLGRMASTQTKPRCYAPGMGYFDPQPVKQPEELFSLELNSSTF